MMVKKQLPEKQQRFIELWNGNATETAAAAGYIAAERAGVRLMKSVRICQAIKENREKELKPQVMSRIERQEFWTTIIKRATEDTKDRLKASELLGKSEGDFLERIEVEEKSTVRILVKRDEITD